MTPEQAREIVDGITSDKWTSNERTMGRVIVQALTAAGAFKVEPAPALHRGVGEGPCVACGAEYPTVGPCPGVPAEPTITKSQAFEVVAYCQRYYGPHVFEAAWAAVTGAKP